MGLLSFFSKCSANPEQANKDSELVSEDLFFSKNATILIVDDSKTHVVACEKWLYEAGYKTLVAFDGREAIHTTKREQPDLILMDIVMPDVNGFQATRFLKRQADTRHIPIILISGEEQHSGKIWAKKLGASSFLVKPMKKDALLNITTKILEPFAVSST